MNDSGTMRLVERLGDFDPVPDHVGDGEGAAAETIGQVLAVEVLHHQEIDAAFVADVVERADVGMIQRGDGPRLAIEPLTQGGRVDQGRGQHLDGDHAIQPRVARTVDLAHPACAEGGENFVGTESGAGGRLRPADYTALSSIEGGALEINQSRTCRRFTRMRGFAVARLIHPCHLCCLWPWPLQARLRRVGSLARGRIASRFAGSADNRRLVGNKTLLTRGKATRLRAANAASLRAAKLRAHRTK